MSTRWLCNTTFIPQMCLHSTEGATATVDKSRTMNKILENLRQSIIHILSSKNVFNPFLLFGIQSDGTHQSLSVELQVLKRLLNSIHFCILCISPHLTKPQACDNSRTLHPQLEAYGRRRQKFKAEPKGSFSVIRFSIKSWAITT